MNIRNELPINFFGSQNDSNSSRNKLPNFILDQLSAIRYTELDYYRILQAFCSRLENNVNISNFPEYDYSKLKKLIHQLDAIYKYHQFNYAEPCELTDKRFKQTVDLICSNWYALMEYRNIFSPVSLDSGSTSLLPFTASNALSSFPNISINVAVDGVPQTVNLNTYNIYRSAVQNKILYDNINEVLEIAKKSSNPNESVKASLSITENLLETINFICNDITRSKNELKKIRPSDYKHTNSSDFDDWDSTFTTWCHTIDKQPIVLLNTIHNLYKYVENYKVLMEHWEVKLPKRNNHFIDIPMSIPSNYLKPETWENEYKKTLQLLGLQKNGLEDAHHALVYMTFYFYEKNFLQYNVFEEVNDDDYAALEQVLL